MNKENVDSATDLLSALSHEIKNSLNIINAMCSMVGNNIDDRERALKYLNRIGDVTERIVSIMDRSLDVSKAKERNACYGERSFNMSDLKDELEELLFPFARNKGLDFKVIFKNFRNRNVISDYDRIFQILINLATNSIKYTPKGGTVIISLEEEETIDKNFMACRFICSDNGIGISSDFLQHIFEPFTRADDDRVKQINGNGLGMTIVKEAVNDMGGSIHIDSMVDAGTTVTIRLKMKNNIGKG